MGTLSVCLLLAITVAVALGAERESVTDPNSPELRAYAAPLQLDESQYGCGPLLQPGRTFYVALSGNDEADGTSWESAWRHVHVAVKRLGPGDTLVIGEGEYVEPTIAMNVDEPQSGEPGRPIIITAAPRHRVIITGGQHPQLSPAPGTQYCWQAEMDIPRGEASVWESDTQIHLQPTGSLQMCDELPGTWWYDLERKVLYAHFSDSRGAEVHGLSVWPGKGSTSNFYLRDDRGLDIRASYVCLRGLHFCNYNTAVLISGNPEGEGDQRTWRGGDHVTIERCSFSSTTFAGLVLWQGARWCLMRDNYGCRNGDRGSMLVNHKSAHDNLFIRNRFDSSAPTIREGGWTYHFGVSTYGHVGRGNHIIGNIMNDVQSFRSKYMFQQAVVEGNVMLGAASTVPCTYPGQQPKDLFMGPEDRVIFRGNVFMRGFATEFQPQPDIGPGGNWLDDYKVFINNYVPGKVSVEQARFADPAWLDYRLQPDSPLKGAGLGGYDIGGYRRPAGRVWYVSPDGDDANSGVTDRQPLATLTRAAAALQPGDTLYVMGRQWSEPLQVAASGTEDAPIVIRAHGRVPVALPAIHLAGQALVVEGFTIAGAQGDGIVVTGPGASVRECVIRQCGGAAIRATGAPGLSVERCTIVGNEVGVALEQGSTAAAVRDCIIADNRLAPVSISTDSAADYLASHNCYWGPGADAERTAREMRSVIGEPRFADDDLRLAWDSPAAHRAMYGQPAGARPALPHTPQISDVQVATLSDDAAVITWRTPVDDTTGAVSYRVQGAGEWRRAEVVTLGTVHGVGLSQLAPATRYEYAIEVKSRRGGTARSETLTFTTSDRPHAPATYYLSPQGDDAADGLAPQSAWRTLRRACAAVLPGDTVLLGAGVYHQAIAPLCGGAEGRRITFRRAGEGRAIIDGLGVLAPLADLRGRSYVTLEGLIFDSLPPAGHDGVILARDARGVEVLNCRIGYNKAHGGFGNGIYLAACPGARVEGNLIWGTRYHVTLAESPGAVVKNNTVSWGQVFSIYVTGRHEGTRITNNIFYFPTSVPNAALAISWADRNINLESDYNCWGPMVDKTHVAYVYHTSVNDLGPQGPSLAQWQADSGLDTHSIQADPMFADPRQGNFTLLPGSPCIGAGEGGVNMGALDPLILTREP